MKARCWQTVNDRDSSLYHVERVAAPSSTFVFFNRPVPHTRYWAAVERRLARGDEEGCGVEGEGAAGRPDGGDVAIPPISRSR